MADRRTGNALLDHLPAHLFATIDPLLKRVEVKHGEIVFEVDEPMQHIFFPVDSIVSVVKETADGEIAEVGIVGCEGMSGISVVLGREQSLQRGVVQVPNDALRLPIADFRKLMDSEADVKQELLRYVYAVLTTISHLSACNTLHAVHERCARWLLMAHDRVQSDTYYLTQEFLSQMLGVRRSSVTLAASTLQASELISYSRGQIIVRDREKLESVACECYASVERDWKKIMGYSISKTHALAG